MTNRQDVGQRPLKVLLFGGQLAHSGLTVAFITLLNTLVKYDLELTVATDGDPVLTSPAGIVNLQKLPNGITLVHRQGGMTLHEDERVALQDFYRENTFSSPAQTALVHHAFKRESRRMFGDESFDVVLDFCGYSRFWGLLFANVPARHRAIWQHNDLFSDARERVCVLHGVFQVYRWFDRVVSVCEETRAVNMRNLGHHFATPAASATVRNLIDDMAIRHNAKTPVFARRDAITRFIAIGRLSPEKAHGRAIRAVANLVKGGHEIELLILGDGPLRTELEALVDTLGMKDRILFLGHVDNPFPYLASSDCLVLPSDYEGQALVLLEALVLGIPIIATDMPCTRGMLQHTPGSLAAPTVDAMTTCMAGFLQGKVGTTPFDATAYRAAALQDFAVQALGLPAMPPIFSPCAA